MKSDTLPSEYLSPKWQAYVTPYSRYFTFANGTSVGSMWELKQALLNLPEDIIMHHLRGQDNDIASWAEKVVGDADLGHELRRYQHRWGLIVALERQMMRTLFLPHFVARRWLAKVDQPFQFVDGRSVQSLEELKDILASVEDEVVAFHCERNPNDVAVWVADIIGDYELADLLEEVTTRSQMERIITDHLEMLVEATLEC